VLYALSVPSVRGTCTKLLSPYTANDLDSNTIHGLLTKDTQFAAKLDGC
jgi:hypothetical protein